jgi:drug/metabolite transporter (DMT)-like permease
VIPQILLAVALVVSAQVLLKQGMATLSLQSTDLQHPLALARRVLSVPSVAFGLLLYVVSAAAWIVVLSQAPLSFAFPFLGLAYVGVTLVAVVYLGERFSLIQWAGLAFVLLGVFLVATSA